MLRGFSQIAIQAGFWSNVWTKHHRRLAFVGHWVVASEIDTSDSISSESKPFVLPNNRDMDRTLQIAETSTKCRGG